MTLSRSTFLVACGNALSSLSQKVSARFIYIYNFNISCPRMPHHYNILLKGWPPLIIQECNTIIPAERLTYRIAYRTCYIPPVCSLESFTNHVIVFLQIMVTFFSCRIQIGISKVWYVTLTFSGVATWLEHTGLRYSVVHAHMCCSIYCAYCMAMKCWFPAGSKSMFALYEKAQAPAGSHS